MVSSCEELLKSALAAGDFPEAQRLLPAYGKELVMLLSEPSQQEHQQAMESFHNLLALARVMRAHLSTQLSNLQRQACYRYDVLPSDRHSWRFEA